MTFEEFKMDCRERFLNYETAKGLYNVPTGILIFYAAIFHVSFVIQVAFAILGWYLFTDGIRKIFINRVKQSIAREQLKKERIEENSETELKEVFQSTGGTS